MVKRIRCSFGSIAAALAATVMAPMLAGCHEEDSRKEGTPATPEQLKAAQDWFKIRDVLAELTADSKTSQFTDGVNTLRDLAEFRKKCETHLAALDQVNKEVEVLEEKTEEAPTERPKKPKLADYQDVQRMCGAVRGTFISGEGGIVLIRGGEYYVVHGAEPSFFSQVCGYVRDDGGDIMLDNGHMAHSVSVSDAVEYKEDLAKASESLKDAMAGYRKELQRWQDAKKPGYSTTRNEALTHLSQARFHRSELLTPLKECGKSS